MGNYVVIAENPAGKDQTNCSVSVTFVPNIDETPLVNPDAFRFLEHPAQQKPREEKDAMSPPKVIVPLANVQLTEGQPIVLACKIQGLPKPTVNIQFLLMLNFNCLKNKNLVIFKLTWYKDSNVLPASTR